MAIQDDAKNFLLSALSRAGGDLPSLQMEWLATQGYTRGTIDDRWQAYLSANAYYLPEGLSRLLVGLNRAIGNNWTPNLLYSDGDILLWYDPSDLTTMFKDTAGTQPVTADGDSVALMLDKGQWGGKTLSQVLAAQTELVTNGTFDSDTNWTKGSSWTISGGVASCSGTTGQRLVYAGTLPSPLVLGRAYRITGTVTGGSVGLLLAQSSNVDVNVSGSFSVVVIAGAAGGTLDDDYFAVRDSGSAATIDNVSIKQIPGFARTQATGTSMPKYKTGPNPAAAENSPDLKGIGVIDITGTATAATYNTSTGEGSVSRVDLLNQSFVTFSPLDDTIYHAMSVTCLTGTVLVRSGTFSGTTLYTLPAGATLLFPATLTTRLSITHTTAVGTSTFVVNSLKEIPASAPYIHWLLYDGTDDGHATGTIPFNTVTSDGAARRNLLTEPDKFDHTTWAKTGIAVTGGSPDNTALVANGVNINTSFSGYYTAGVTAYASQSYTSLPAGTYTYWMRVKADGYDAFQVRAATNSSLSTAVTNGTCLVDLTDGTLADGVNGSVVDLGDGYYRVGVTFTLGAPTTVYLGFWAWNSTSTTADGTDGYLITHAQLELGSTATDFQNIGTDEVSVCAGVTKSSDAAAGVVAELSASSSANTGTFGLFAPSTAATNYQFRSKGSTDRSVTLSPYVAPTTNVLTAQGDISADDADVRVDGVLDAGTPSGAAGTGNFGSYPMYFGRRGGSSLPFNGREYQTVIRSRLLSAAELASLETFVAAKTGVVL